MAKWGKIGAPKSAKRRAHLAKIRKKIKKGTSIKKSRKTTKKRKVSRVARKKRRRRSGFSTASMFKYLRLAALLAPAAHSALRPGVSAKDKVADAIEKYSGYNLGNNTFSWAKLGSGWLPIIATSLVTVGVSKINGIIRRL